MGFLGDIGSVVGGIFGSGDDADERKKALDLYQDSFKGYDNLDKMSQGQQFVPYQTQSLGQSAFTQGQAPQQGRDAQSEALARMMNVAKEGGLDATSRAAYDQAINASNANEASNRAALLQNYNQRGVGGSGVSMAAQLANQQGSANRMNQAGLGVAANARQNALAALSSAGQMGSQLNNQDYNQFANKAKAQDTINQFNWVNSQQNANNNANRQMQFGQQQWQNAYNTEGGRNQARQNMANIYTKAGENAYGRDVAMGSAVGSVGDDFNNSMADVVKMIGGGK